MVSIIKVKSISIRKDQDLFLKTQPNFCLSRFIQAKLDKYIELREENQSFMDSVEKEELKYGKKTID